MELITTFWLAFFFSFIGSIPPGTLNMSMIQLGLDRKMTIAWRFGIAAALIEYPYAWVAVEFQSVITSFPFVIRHFQLITGLVMIVVGIFNYRSAIKPSTFSQKLQASGFRRGLVLSILNPMALPFWIGITAYLKSLSWIDLSDQREIHFYLFGVSVGALTLLMLFAYIARSLIQHLGQFSLIRKIPGMVLIGLGFFAIADYLRMNLSIA